MPEQTMRDAAVALTAYFRVFKLQVNGKTPAHERWLKVASDDPEIVRKMWTDPVSGESEHNNIGILTGIGFYVVDVDVKNGAMGSDSLEMLKDLGLDTDTVSAQTPSGGFHLYYRSAGNVTVKNSANLLGPGIDVRGWHGYVVAPPSTIDGVPYRWLSPPVPMETSH
jgi:putative DNA primase/helicase